MEKLTNLSRSIRLASLATLIALVVHYACFYWLGSPLWTEAIAKWIMANTPSSAAIWILDAMGAWAKPFALTGGLATLGFFVWVVLQFSKILDGWYQRTLLLIGGTLAATLLAWLFEGGSILATLSFWVPALLVLDRVPLDFVSEAPVDTSRRTLLARTGRAVLPAVMSSGVLAVAVESYYRNQRAARQAREPVALYSYQLPPERQQFGAGLVRPAITAVEPVDTFYKMSISTVDPAIDPDHWRLRINIDGKTLRELSYAELLALPRTERFVTLRCVSNTLKSNLTGTASWAGIRLSQLVDRRQIPAQMIEAAFIGQDGHGDSFPLDYSFSDEPMLALGMNGKTLNRAHGFPIRLLAPRYYGFKSVKWLTEINFVRQPYFGTWPKTGFTKEPLIHTSSSIDRIRAEGDFLLVGGVSFAGVRGVRAVQVRSGSNPWVEAAMEPALSPYTWTRWVAKVPRVESGEWVQARALDGAGQWQEANEGPLYPHGRVGPTLRRYSP